MVASKFRLLDVVRIFSTPLLMQTNLPSGTGQSTRTEGRVHVNFQNWKKKKLSRTAVLVRDVARPPPLGPLSKNSTLVIFFKHKLLGKLAQKAYEKKIERENFQIFSNKTIFTRERQ